MSRDYLKAGSAQFLPMEVAAKALAVGGEATSLNSFRVISRAPVKGSVAWAAGGERKPVTRGPSPKLKDEYNNETNQVDLTLLQNTFPLSLPALASRSQELMLLYVADNGGSNNFQFTDIEWTRWNGTNWSLPQAIGTNTQAAFAPNSLLK